MLNTTSLCFPVISNITFLIVYALNTEPATRPCDATSEGVSIIQSLLQSVKSVDLRHPAAKRKTFVNKYKKNYTICILDLSMRFNNKEIVILLLDFSGC